MSVWNKKNIDDVINTKYGYLSVLHEIPTYVKNRKRCVLAKCDCGIIKNYILTDIVSGKTKSCGCYHKKIMIKRNTIHGKAKHPLFSIWRNIKERCYNINNSDYKFYGANGVRMCDEWIDNFKAFYDWCIKNGWEQGLQVDKDINGNGLLYSPDTCCIVTSKKNCNKRKSSRYLIFNGIKKTVSEWADEIGISDAAIRTRLKRQWAVEKILTTPMRKRQ